MTDYREKLGEALKQLGMTRAALNAEYHSQGWRELAFFHVTQYPGDVFSSEDVREYAYALGLPKPPDERAWGYVITRAKRTGLIEFHGMSQQRAPHCHKGYSTIWKRIKETGIDLKLFGKGSRVYIHLIRDDFTDEKWALTGPVHGKTGEVVDERREAGGKYHIVAVMVPGHNHNCPELLKARYLTKLEPGEEPPKAAMETGVDGEQIALF